MQQLSSTEDLIRHIEEGLSAVRSGASAGAVLPRGRFQQLVEPGAFRSIIYQDIAAEDQRSLPQSLPELLRDQRFLDMSTDLLAATLQRATRVLSSVQSKGSQRGEAMPQSAAAQLWPAMVREAFAAELASAMRAVVAARGALSRRLEASMNIVPSADAQGQLEDDEADTLLAAGFVVLEEFQGDATLASMVADEVPGALKTGALVAVGPPSEGQAAAAAPPSAAPPATPLLGDGKSTVAAAAVTRTVLESDTYPALKRALSSIRGIPADLNACKGTAGWAMVAPLGGTTTVLFTPCSKAAEAAPVQPSSAASTTGSPADSGECARVFAGRSAGAAAVGGFLRDTLDVQEAVQGQLPGGGGQAQQQAAVLRSAQERAKLGAVLALYWPWGGDETQGGVLLHPTPGSTKQAVYVPAAQDSLLLVRSSDWAVQLLPAVVPQGSAAGASLPLLFSVFHPSLLFSK